MRKAIFTILHYLPFFTYKSLFFFKIYQKLRIEIYSYLLPKQCVNGLVIISLSLILLTEGFGQSPAPQNQKDPYAKLRQRIIEPPKITELKSTNIKIPMVGSKTLPLVEVKLNGKGPYRLLVDTGANVTILQTRVVNELQLPNLKPIGKPIYAVESLKIGDAYFKDFLVSARSWEEQIDGVIGFNLFANCLLTMDYLHQKFILRKGALPPETAKTFSTMF